MLTPLNASTTSAGSLMSGYTFEVPPYQREYAWEQDEIADFWSDLKEAAAHDSYFLGLIILTEQDGRMHVVDGQQRILSLTLLAAALFHEARKSERKALADRLQADFLYSINYETDEVSPRVSLADNIDDETLKTILTTGEIEEELAQKGDLAKRMGAAFRYLQERLREELKLDPFRKLGFWTDFITNRLYFAVFVHPNAASAYRVFEVINTRGKELTTAELLKNYVLSQTPPQQRVSRFERWQRLSRSFSIGSGTFVQFIRHVVTVEAGHVLPKDLFDFVAGRQSTAAKQPPSISRLMNMLDQALPLYLQMVDPTTEGPAEQEMLGVFAALNSLGVISVRPILLAIAATANPVKGMHEVLRLVVRRIVAGNLGTGNVERIFGDTALKIRDQNRWEDAIQDLKMELDPRDEAFLEQIQTKSFNKSALSYLRRSLVQMTMTPAEVGVLHFIAPRHYTSWDKLGDEELKYWGGTLANTLLANLERRPKAASSWSGLKATMLTHASPGELINELTVFEHWDVGSLEHISSRLARRAERIWC